MIRFTVIGKPQPRGSKRAFPIPNKFGGIRISVTDTNKKSGPWMKVVAETARCAMNGDGLLNGPLMLNVKFFFARPKGHIGKRGLKPSAPVHHTVKPDTTKLLRGLEDALKGVCWRDDSQVVEQTATKEYGEYDHSVVTIVELPEIDDKKTESESAA